ncbi:hypothetical protein [Ethanoligenens sp.]|uniref:hypothetical protein n=1 Tax=Ethanoligenens sp. TaxID=2099655 RepID=UPI0039EC2853
MTSTVKQRLCGGTFFTLFLRARKPLRGANEYYTGNPEPYSEPMALFALSKVIVTDWKSIFAYADSTVSGNTSEYKTCKNEGGSIYPFGDDAALTSFGERVKESYPAVLSEMCKVIGLLIDTGSMKKDERLVKELIALIGVDDSIKNSQPFYVLENGDAITKADLLQATNICLQPFLLGVWYFAVTRSEKNTFGKETIDLWCPSTGGGKREYKGNLENLITRNITLTYREPFKESAYAEIVDNPLVDEPLTSDEPRSEEQSTEKEPAASNLTQQVINNNPTFFNFNVSGNNNSFYNHVDTVNIKNGGQKDE